MIFLQKIIREPLFHFLMIGLTLFFIFDMTVSIDSDTNNSKLTISKQLQTRLGLQFETTWKRKPTDTELSNLINKYLREEVLYREAVLLGLDRNDTVIRQRLRQKMEFLMEPAASLLNVSDQELKTYFKQNIDQYILPHKVSFVQVYLGEQPDNRLIESVQDKLSKKITLEEAEQLGKTSLLPYHTPLQSKEKIEQTFGNRFGAALMSSTSNSWVGPVSSTYGVHFLYILNRSVATRPEFEQVRSKVLKDWRYQKIKEAKEQQLQTLLKKYTVVIEPQDERQPDE